MSFQSGIHAKMAIFDRKSHAPETSEGSESGSILLVRLFFICQATFLSFDILSVAWAERGFGGGLGLPSSKYSSLNGDWAINSPLGGPENQQLTSFTQS